MLAPALRWRSARAGFNTEHEKLSKQMLLLRGLLPSPSSSPPHSPVRDFQQIVPKLCVLWGSRKGSESPAGL